MQMLTAYVSQASLVTFYLLALLTIRFDRPKALRNKPWMIRILRAAQHSTTNFLNASFLFCIAMLLASVVQISRALLRTETMTTVAYMASMLMSFNSVLPVVVLQLAASNRLRRAHGRTVLWALIAIMTSCVVGLGFGFAFGFRNYYYFEVDTDAQSWEMTCLPSSYIIVLPLSMGPLISLSIAGYMFTLLAKKIWRFVESPWRTRLSTILWWTGLVLAFCTMWLSLGWFIQFQRSAQRVAGEDNKDTQWSFGQVLALATWAPVVVEFVYIWWEGPTEALTGRLMEPYEVVEVSKEEEAFEPTRRTATV
jgi:hypothetical protein